MANPRLRASLCSGSTGIYSVEALEQMRNVLGWDTNPWIANRQRDRPMLLFNQQRDAAVAGL